MPLPYCNHGFCMLLSCIIACLSWQSQGCSLVEDTYSGAKMPPKSHSLHGITMYNVAVNMLYLYCQHVEHVPHLEAMECTSPANVHEV